MSDVDEVVAGARGGGSAGGAEGDVGSGCCGLDIAVPGSGSVVTARSSIATGRFQQYRRSEPIEPGSSCRDAP
jgi:hypothetical protein